MYILNGIHFTLTVLIVSIFHTHCADLVLFEKNKYQAPAGSSFVLLPSDVIDVIVYCVAPCTKKDALSLRVTCTSFAKAFLFVKNQLALDLTLLAEPLPHNPTLLNKSHIIHQLLLSGRLQIKDAISFPAMNSSGFKLFCQAINHLTNLDLWNTDIGSVDAQHLSDALTNNSSITTLNVSRNKIGADGTRYISDLLKNNTTLTALNVGGNKIGDDGTRYISDLLKNNTTITTLNVSYNKIGDDGARYVFVALISNTTLTTLNVRGNRIGADGTRYIADALKKNTTLTHLDSEDNKIDTIGAQHLSDAVKNNSSLTTLNLEDNKISAIGARYLSDARKNNTTLINLYLGSIIFISRYDQHLIKE